jgi:hypothetical protein
MAILSATLMALVAMSGQFGVDAQKVDSDGIMSVVASKIDKTLADQIANGPATYPHLRYAQLVAGSPPAYFLAYEGRLLQFLRILADP